MIKNSYSKLVAIVFSLESIKKMAICFLIASFGALLIANTTFAQWPGQTGSKTQYLTDIGAGDSAKDQANLFVNFFLGFLGFVATAMIIYGGFLYTTAAGNQEQTDQGKKILMYSIVGILIIVISYAIINTVLTYAPGGQTETSQGG